MMMMHGPLHKQRQQRHKQRRNQQHQQRKKQQETEELSLEEQSKYVALDCEMVGVVVRSNNSDDNDHHQHESSSVARVTLVDFHRNIILDEFVKQTHEVVDYRTYVSGITEIDLQQNASFTIEEIRQKVQSILCDKVLVGHALKNDLRALGITHPWHSTRDTAKYEPFMQVRFDDGILWPRKLRDLVHEKLHRDDFQVPGQPHSPYEDAVAAMDLYRLFRKKWEKVMDYKIQKTKEIESKHFQKQ